MSEKLLAKTTYNTRIHILCKEQDALNHRI